MTALDAKNSFGTFLDTVQREPVTVTKNRRQVGTMFSIEDLNDMARSYLAEPILSDVELGKISVADALVAQTKINKRLEDSRRSISEGKGIVADSAYFTNLHERALQRRNK